MWAVNDYEKDVLDQRLILDLFMLTVESLDGSTVNERENKNLKKKTEKHSRSIYKFLFVSFYEFIIIKCIHLLEIKINLINN